MGRPGGSQSLVPSERNRPETSLGQYGSGCTLAAFEAGLQIRHSRQIMTAIKGYLSTIDYTGDPPLGKLALQKGIQPCASESLL